MTDTTSPLSFLAPEALQMFAKVVELGGFTRAAEHLQVPKARVSMAVQQLETRLGTRLLHRTTRKVQPTQDGHALYERCKDVLADLDELQAMFQQGPQALRGRLRIDLPTGVACHQIIPRLPQFLREHPQLDIELSSTDRRVDLVREGFDCVLRVGDVGDGSFVARRIGEFRQINCASPAYLRRHGKPRTLDDLARHRVVHYAPAFGARPAAWEYMDGNGLRTRPMASALSVNSVQAYESACVAGLGLIQAPALGMTRLIEQGALVEVLPAYRAPPLPVSLLYASRRNLSQRLQVAMAWIEKVLRPHLDRPASPA